MRRIVLLAAVPIAALAGCDGEPLVPELDEGRTPKVLFSHAPDGEFEWVPTGLGTLGGATSAAYDINDYGLIVGESRTAAGQPRAFLWSEGTGMTDLGTFGGLRSAAYGINSAGTVVGEARDAAGVDLAFRLPVGGAMQELPVLAGTARCQARAVNDDEQVVGVCYEQIAATEWFAAIWDVAGTTVTALGELPPDRPYGWAVAINNEAAVVGDAWGADESEAVPAAFHWDDGLMTEIQEMAAANAINAAGAIAGRSRFNGSTRATIWPGLGSAPQNLGTLPGTASSEAFGINDAGQVVGQAGSKAFFWEDDQMIELPPLPGDPVARAFAINSAGDAVVGWSGTFAAPQAVIWRFTQVILDCSYAGIRARLGGLEADGTLSSRQARSLHRNLDQAERFEGLGERHYDRAIARLQSFSDEVRALEGEGVMTQTEADRLVHCVDERIEGLQST